MVLVHETSSQCALQMYEFLLKYLIVIKSYSGHDFVTTYVTKGDNLKTTHARVMVLMYDTLSQCALQMYEVSLKYL